MKLRALFFVSGLLVAGCDAGGGGPCTMFCDPSQFALHPGSDAATSGDGGSDGGDHNNNNQDPTNPDLSPKGPIFGSQ